ncbi:MAG: hypothetical protein ACKV2V_22530, partial [Blastocatellia bacterium]
GFAWLNFTGMRRTVSAKKKSNANDTLTRSMSKIKIPETQFVVCLNNSDYPASLELHKIYRVLPDDDAAADGDIRIVDESGEDYLYPADWFVSISLPKAIEDSLRRAA